MFIVFSDVILHRWASGTRRLEGN